MATTYRKPDISVGITTLMGSSYMAETENGVPYGTYAIDAFENHKTMDVNDVLIPFHAVKMIRKSITATTGTKEDAYCK